MFSVVKNYLKYGNSYVGIEHTTLDHKELIHILELRNKKSELHINKEHEVLDLDEIPSHISSNQHAYLIINTNKVLSKKVPGKLELVKAVQTAFTNIKTEDFYIESYTNGNDTFVNICRKDYIDDLLDSYQEIKIFVLGFSLGNTLTSAITPYVNEDVFLTSNAQITKLQTGIVDISPSINQEKNTYQINGLNLRSNSINAFAGILSYLTNSSSVANNFSDISENLKYQFNQQKIFDHGLKFSLGFLFITLLVNFMIFSHYNEKINLSSNELIINQQYESKLKALKVEVDKKKKIVEEMNNSESNQVAYYLDEIAKSVPASILLTELNFQPISKNIKKNKEVKITEGDIILKGASVKGDPFSNWLEVLEKLEWIEHVTVHEYGLNKKSENEFEVKLILKS